MQVIFLKNIKVWLIAGFIFTAVFGTLSHFFYDWSGENPLIGLISPVNESTWEHMKLVFFPVLSGILGTFAVPVLFYTYSGILGRNVAWIDILIFFICVFVTFFSAWKLQNSVKIYQKRAAIYLAVVFLIILFFLFTFLPPDIGLFAEP